VRQYSLSLFSEAAHSTPSLLLQISHSPPPILRI
jgi:hypothetical protein